MSQSFSYFRFGVITVLIISLLLVPSCSIPTPGLSTAESTTELTAAEAQLCSDTYEGWIALANNPLFADKSVDVTIPTPPAPVITQPGNNNVLPIGTVDIVFHLNFTPSNDYDYHYAYVNIMRVDGSNITTDKIVPFPIESDQHSYWSPTSAGIYLIMIGWRYEADKNGSIWNGPTSTSYICVKVNESSTTEQPFSPNELTECAYQAATMATEFDETSVGDPNPGNIPVDQNGIYPAPDPPVIDQPSDGSAYPFGPVDIAFHFVPPNLFQLNYEMDLIAAPLGQPENMGTYVKQIIGILGSTTTSSVQWNPSKAGKYVVVVAFRYTNQGFFPMNSSNGHISYASVCVFIKPVQAVVNPPEVSLPDDGLTFTPEPPITAEDHQLCADNADAIASLYNGETYVLVTPIAPLYQSGIPKPEGLAITSPIDGSILSTGAPIQIYFTSSGPASGYVLGFSLIVLDLAQGLPNPIVQKDIPPFQAPLMTLVEEWTPGAPGKYLVMVMSQNLQEGGAVEGPYAYDYICVKVEVPKAGPANNPQVVLPPIGLPTSTPTYTPIPYVPPTPTFTPAPACHDYGTSQDMCLADPYHIGGCWWSTDKGSCQP